MEAELKEAFRMLDSKSVGYITPTEMELVCRQLGEDLNEDQVRGILWLPRRCPLSPPNEPPCRAARPARCTT